MSRRQRSPLPPPHDYAPDIHRLDQQLGALTLRWQGMAPTPPSLAEAVEELATTAEELHAMNADLIESQQAAIESQRRYQELFDGVPEAYLVTDIHGLIREANRPAAHLLHIDRAHLTGLPLAVFVAPEMRSAFRKQLAGLKHGAEVREWVIRVQPRHQPPVPVVCHVVPALDADGQLIGLRWLLRDLKAPPQLQATLEQHVRELMAKLDQAELRGRALHHRTTIDLLLVATMLDWQREDLQDPRARAIFRACQGRLRAMALVHELLYRGGDLARLELGPYLRRLAVQVFQVYGLDGERVHLMLQADPVRVEVNTVISCGLLVHEVLSNCLQHAFPAPQAGAIAITLRADPAGQVTLTIRDTGVGMPADWEVRDAEGFGLRLVRALTQQLQGTLVVARDRGTCVTLRFPVSSAGA
jgi:PAS domain S-box-containing protein